MFPRRTWAILVLVVLLGVLLAGGYVYLVKRGTEEATALGPWPGVDVSAQDVAYFDLTTLGLQPVATRDARAIYGQAFADGEVVEYGAGGKPAAVVGALRYRSSGDAGSDFDSFEAWAQASCGRWLTAHFRGVGVIHCDFADSHDLILWSDNWILDVEAGALGEMAASDLAGKIGAAAAAHWKGQPSGLK